MRQRGGWRMKKITLQLTEQDAQELADLRIVLGLAPEEDREELIKRSLEPRECLLG